MYGFIFFMPLAFRERMVELCGEKNIEPYGRNKFLVNFPFVNDDLGYNMLPGFGDKCECWHLKMCEGN